MRNLLPLLLLLSCGDPQKEMYVVESVDEEVLADIAQQNQDNLDRIDELELEIEVLGSEYEDNGEKVEALEEQINQNNAKIIELEGKITIEQIVDPCGDHPGHYDEVLLLLSDGSILAYFGHRSKRFLTKLSDGNYRTTDKQKCVFSVVDGEIIW